MIDIEIKPYPGESENSFIKREAYYIRLLEGRMAAGKGCFPVKTIYSTPITNAQKAEINAYWGNYLSEELRNRLICDTYYDIYNSVLSDGEHLCYYMPDSFYYAFIDDYFTDPQHSYPCDDKNLYDLYFHDVNRPVTIFRKTEGFILDGHYQEITLSDAIAKCKVENEVILKKVKYSVGGKGLLFWNAQQPEEDLVRFLEESKEVVCERIINQHAELSRINPTSVNTVRIMTLAFKGKVHVLSSVLRMGINGARVDNASSGGIVCGINPDGQLKNVAYTYLGQKFLKHPQGIAFESVKVPNFGECIEIVAKLAKRFSGISKLISWDLAIDESGHPMLIEFNLTYGELDFHQLCNGPIFGDLTDDVLNEVFANSYTLNSIIKSYN